MYSKLKFGCACSGSSKETHIGLDHLAFDAVNDKDTTLDTENLLNDILKVDKYNPTQI